MVSTSQFAAARICLLLTLVASAAFFGAEEVSGASLTASWVDSSNGVATTRLERRGGSAAGFATIADVPPGVTQYVDDSISAGTEYCYRALAYTAAGVSPYSEEVCAKSADAVGTTPPPPPASELGVSFTNPASGATVDGTATVTLSATGGTGYNFKINVDDAQVYAGMNPGFSWNTTTVANGSRVLTATVTDAQNRTAMASRTVTVANSSNTTPPPLSSGASFTVSFSYPASGATVRGSQTVGLSTTAAWDQSKTFTLSIDGQTLTSESATGTTLWYTWDTTRVGNGSRTLSATVTMNGQTATTTQAVTVANSSNTSPLPLFTGASFTVSFSYPASGATVSGAQTVGLSTTATWGLSKTLTLSIDGQTVTSERAMGTTFWYTWDTTTVGNGSRTLSATVTMNGQTATTTQAVTVANSGATGARP
jgi:hypothetical protein